MCFPLLFLPGRPWQAPLHCFMPLVFFIGHVSKCPWHPGSVVRLSSPWTFRFCLSFSCASPRHADTAKVPLTSKVRDDTRRLPTAQRAAHGHQGIESSCPSNRLYCFVLSCCHTMNSPKHNDETISLTIFKYHDNTRLRNTYEQNISQ